MSHGGASHGIGEENKRIAILISVLALFLAISEVLGKSAQTALLSHNIEASNLWSFYQAKTIRQTVLKTAAEQLEIDGGLAKDPAVKKLIDGRVAAWKEEVTRYQSEPKAGGGEGRSELAARAKKEGELRDLAGAKYHNFEFASSAFQIAMVLASAFLITGVIYLLWGAFALGGFGVMFLLLGQFAPNLLHL